MATIEIKSPTDRYKAIADAIREKTGTTELMQPADMPQAILDISGDGELIGREKQYNEFWDNFQQNGTRTNYSYGFAGLGWNDNNFKPKYDIVPVGATASYIFANTLITNLKQILIDCGVTLDFSQATSFNYPFQNSEITDIGIVNVSGLKELKYFLYGSRKLKNIEKLILKDDGSQKFDPTYAFGNCDALTHIIFEGTIGQNGFDIHWSLLDEESLLSILNALQDKTSDTSGTEWKIKIGATNMAKLTKEQLQIAYNKGWAVE